MQYATESTDDSSSCSFRGTPQPPAQPFSGIGRKLTSHSAILELMDDLGQAMALRPEVLMLGGGNPGVVPELQAIWRRLMRDLLAKESVFDSMLANYEPPRGNPRFLRAFAALLEQKLGWPLGPEHVAVTSGTQTAFFFLFNLLAGRQTGSTRRKILLPLCPEYIGYADQGLEDGLFVSCQPLVTWPDLVGRVFKYGIDFDAVTHRLSAGDIAAVAISRPTNPTGNVLTEGELDRLSELTAEHGIYLIIDGAYGLPFPGVVFTPARPRYAPHIINTFSFSKLGLPGIRTGLVVGPPEITSAITAWTAVVGLANANVGQQLLLPLVESGELLELGPRVLQPFYRERCRAALAAVREYLEPTGVNWAVHASEGAFFLWLWLRGLGISATQLYHRLKARDVLVVPGSFFYYGLSEPVSHQDECLRISFAQPPERVREGIRRLAEELMECG
jgi:valine--pyruvate aminotransferase